MMLRFRCGHRLLDMRPHLIERLASVFKSLRKRHAADRDRRARTLSKKVPLLMRLARR
jgi:hypothetical protein